MSHVGRAHAGGHHHGVGGHEHAHGAHHVEGGHEHGEHHGRHHVSFREVADKGPVKALLPTIGTPAQNAIQPSPPTPNTTTTTPPPAPPPVQGLVNQAADLLNPAILAGAVAAATSPANFNNALTNVTAGLPTGFA